MAAQAPPKTPLIAIVGATGTGKSQLAVELATRFDGEIINADAMQLYKGLPIITNKITTQEQKGIPHHLLGTISLDKPTWTVGKFVESAKRCIEDIHARGKVPIVVGGTHYYTQALLFRNAVVEQHESPEDTIEDGKRITEQDRSAIDAVLQQDTAVILAKLREVDSIMADRWHPNDRRKIQRSLEIYLQTGKTASATYEEQQRARTDAVAENDDGGTGGGLQYPTLLLWLHCNNDKLRARLDSRVNGMLAAGLLNEVAELESFHNAQISSGHDIDLTRGIWVSIGYKEFQSYQQGCTAGQSSEKELQKAKQQAVEATQAATRQYARRQVRWIRIKLLSAMHAQKREGAMYLLDGSDLAQWGGDVARPATDLVEAFLAGGEMPDPLVVSTAAAEYLTPHRNDMSQHPEQWQRRECDACNAVFVTEDSWEKHVKSKGHRYHLKRLRLEAAKTNGTEPGEQGVNVTF